MGRPHHRELNLKYGRVEHPVRLRSCHFDETPDLYGARLRVLALNDSVLPGLTAGHLHVDGVLRLTCCRIKGPVRLAGAQTSGAVFANGAHIGDPAATEPPEEPVLQLNHADIGTDLWAPGLVAHGRIRLNGATVGGQVTLDDAQLNAPGDHALEAQTLSVGTDVHAMRLRAHGRVDLRGARIGGQLNLAYAALGNPGGVALRVSSCVVGEMWLREAKPVVGTVNLRRAQFDVLYVPPEVWPDEVKLDRLTYGSLLPHLPAEERLPVLERERAGYVSYSYEQLAGAYRAAGTKPQPAPSSWPNSAATAAPCPGTPRSGVTFRTPQSATASVRCAPPAGCWPCCSSAPSPSPCTRHAR